ncbi:MAG: nuclear transport factor 2 family protein [Saprospiraceae bacterium]
MTNKMLKKIKFGIVITLILFGTYANAQSESSKSEIEEITATLMNYIDGTANGEIDKLRKAFHPDFNLYSVTKEDSLRVWKGEDYIGGIEQGKKSNRIGRIISIDFENDAAIAKAEILIPNWRVFTDYFLLLKYEGSWKIVHKSYTWREIPKKDE